MSDSFFDRFVDDYYAECEEHLTSIRRSLLALEGSIGQPRPDAAVTEELFRSFHSMKGIAGMVEHRQAEMLAHEMESYLRALREGEVTLSTHGVELLIGGTRTLEHAIAAHRAREPQPDIDPMLSNLRTLSAESATASAALLAAPAVGDRSESWKCVFTPSPDLNARGVNVDMVRARLRERGDIRRAMPLVAAGGGIAFEFVFRGHLDDATREAWTADGMLCSPASAAEDAVEALEPSVAERTGSVLSSGHYVRVDLARLDDLMRMIGDLVIMRARLVDALAPLEGSVPPTAWRGIQETTGSIESRLRDLREGVMRVRLVPVGEVFRRMPFVVRDLARDTGRRVRVELKGQETEIDKFLVERMMDPVLHLVRNAVAHGIESVDERVALGKSPEATLLLSASAAGEIVTIEIADDGRGIDRERVVARARAAGLEVPSVVDDAAILDLICAPGFSTREDTDRGSGRGFGMAVVRRTVQELGGSMRLVTEEGRGTRFTVDLPLTLAITDALIAHVGAEIYAVPQAAVREVIEIDAAAIRGLPGSEVTAYRGAALPLVRISSVLGVTGRPGARLHAFVIGSGTAAVGLVVDRIRGQREIVVRSTSDPLMRVDGIAGATDLGDGKVVLILDGLALSRGHRQRAHVVASSA